MQYSQDLFPGSIRDVPIAMGMGRPLVRPAKPAADIHGESGLDRPHMPEPTIELARQHAVDLIIDLLMD